jgi:hypothetical protein
MMVNIFTDELKNTRFILTVLALGLLAFFGLAIFILILKPPEKIDEALMALLTTLLGAVIAIVSVAYNSHFKAREEDAAVRVEAAKVEAAKAEPAKVEGAKVEGAKVEGAKVEPAKATAKLIPQ